MSDGDYQMYRRAVLAICFVSATAVLCFTGNTLLFATVAGPATDDTRGAIEETFGVEVECATASFQASGEQWRLRGEAASLEESNRFLRLFAAELFLYPVNAVSASGLKRVVLCKGLTVHGQEVGGTASAGDGTLFLNVSNDSPLAASAAVHHELFHFFDYADDGIVGQDDRWSALNVPGFIYGCGLNSRRDPWALEFTESFPGFLTRYCMAAVEEDKAEVFSHLVVNRSYVLRRAEKDPRLKAKLRAIESSVIAFCPELDEHFWTSAARLSRPLRPPVSSPIDEHRLFLESLKQRGLFDIALDYLALLRAEPGPIEIDMSQLLFDEGRFLTYAARDAPANSSSIELLQSAAARFEEAAKSDHLAARSGLELGDVLVERATEALCIANSPENHSSAKAARQQAQRLLNDAKREYDRVDQMQTSRLREMKKAPTGIGDSNAKALRDNLRGDVLSARLRAANALRTMASAYDAESPEAARLFKLAAAAYREIYARHSRRVAGAVALVGEAQCRQALGDTPNAVAGLEIVLSYPDEEALGAPKANAMKLRLQWLSSCGTSEDDLIASRGKAWLRAAAPRNLGTLDGVGIAYYTARAQLGLASRADKIADRGPLLNEAAMWARFVTDAALPDNPYRLLGNELCDQISARIKEANERNDGTK